MLRRGSGAAAPPVGTTTGVYGAAPPLAADGSDKCSSSSDTDVGTGPGLPPASTASSSAAVGAEGASGDAPPVAHPFAMTDQEALAAAAAATSQPRTRVPEVSGPSGFRSWQAELDLWLLITSVPKNKQAPFMLGALSGVAMRLATTMAPADVTSEDGAAKPVALLSTRFGGQSGAKSMAAYNGLHRCVRRGQPMEEYLVMFDEAALGCDEEGCPITNATKAPIVLNQANLSDNEQAMSMKMANKGSVNTVTYEDMTGALLTLFGDKFKTGTVALVALPAGGRVLRPPLRAPGDGNSVPAGTSLCWYCEKTWHIRKDCHLKAKHQREREVPDGGAVDVGSAGAEVIHMVVLAGTTDSRRLSHPRSGCHGHRLWKEVGGVLCGRPFGVGAQPCHVRAHRHAF